MQGDETRRTNLSQARPFRPAAIVLAGGQSSRLGPGSKAFALLHGRPLLQHVLDRVEPQAERVLISVQDPGVQFPFTQHFCIPDLVQRHRGPLTGLCSAMQYLLAEATSQWLLMCPCDAPFVPPDLAGKLYTVASDTGCPVVVARYDGELQPTFSLWNISVYSQIHEMVMVQGRGGLKTMLDGLPYIAVDWDEAPLPPFFNINTKRDLVRAGELLDANTHPG